jgi:hypothetical protein
MARPIHPYATDVNGSGLFASQRKIRRIERGRHIAMLRTATQTFAAFPSWATDAELRDHLNGVVTAAAKLGIEVST